jgi:spore maturation protein A
MLNYLWGCMILIGVVYAALTGNIDSVTSGALDGAKDAVSLCIIMLGVMAFWCGLMEIAEKSGLIDKCKCGVAPLISWLFPNVPRQSRAFSYITTNMISNFLGLGWAATPAGIRAMQELSELNGHNSVASCDMCTFLVINISSIQLIPVNIIAYRSQYGSANPTSILFPSIIATTCSTFVAVIFCRFMMKREV